MTRRTKSSHIRLNNSKPLKKKAILIGVEFSRNGSKPSNLSMEELKSLAETAYYNPVAIISQKRIIINLQPFTRKKQNLTTFGYVFGEKDG